jgi:orotate phosphoribosyltransferase
MESNVLDLLPIRRGHFRFESGYHGEIWLDLDRLSANPRRIAPLARELAGRLSRHDVEAVGAARRRRVPCADDCSRA